MIPLAPTESDWEQLAQALRSARSVLVVGHVHPDPDALGSALGLALALRDAGVAAEVTFDAEPFAVPESLRWLPGQDIIRAPRECAVPDLVVAVDCSSGDRLGAVLGMAEAAERFVAIDHHRSHVQFAPLALVDAYAPAAGVLVAEAVDRAALPWSPDVATCLLGAIAGDTASFSLPGTTADTHRLAARLIDLGANPLDVSRHLFASRSLALARLSAMMVGQAELHRDAVPGHAVLVASVSGEDRERVGLGYDDVESVVADLSRISDADIALLIKQDDAGAWKVSLRSRGGVDAGQVCAGLGGGGHVGAAGYTSVQRSVSEVQDEVLAALAAAPQQ